MRICFVSPDYPSTQSGGGVGNQTQLLGRAFVRAGHQVTVIALAKPDRVQNLNDDGVGVYSFSPGNWHWYISRLPGIGSALALAIRELEYARGAYLILRRLHAQQAFDLVEATETGSFGLSRLDQRLPLIVRLHGEQYTIQKYTPGQSLSVGIRLGRRVQRSALRSARLLISPSAAHAREIAAELHLDKSAIRVIPNCIDLKRIETNYHRSTERQILFVGRLERSKGVFDLLEALALVVRQLPDVKLCLAGGYHPSLPKEELKARIDRLGLATHVNVLGHLQSGALADVYRRSAVCVLPSYYETFGVAALEAMAFGLPVIASKTSGLCEVIEDGVSGRLAPPGDSLALSQVMLELLSDPSLRARLGQGARERAESHFSVDRIHSLNLETYRQMVENGAD